MPAFFLAGSEDPSFALTAKEQGGQ